MERIYLEGCANCSEGIQKTKLYPLQPPAREDDMLVASLACIAAIQCTNGKKSQKLNKVTNKVTNLVSIQTTTASDKLTITRAK